MRDNPSIFLITATMLILSILSHGSFGLNRLWVLICAGIWKPTSSVVRVSHETTDDIATKLQIGTVSWHFGRDTVIDCKEW